MTAAPAPVAAPAKSSLLASAGGLPRILYSSDIAPVLAICVLGGALRFYHISYLSLWRDEAFSRFYYQTGLYFMWTEGLHSESSPPLYYMALGAWIHLFGSSETALRSLSAVTSTFAIFLVYRLGLELFDRKHAVIAAALFALSATAIYYAQEARCYAFLLIPILVMLIACARYVGGPGRTAHLATYILAATIGIYTHTTMFFVVAACGLVIFSYLLAEHRDLWDRRVTDWICAHFCIAILALPTLIGMLDPTQWAQLDWIPQVSLHQIGAVLSNTVSGTLTPGHVLGGSLAIAVTVLLSISIWRDTRPRPALVVAVAVPGMYTALVIVTSIAVQPILLSRTFSWTVVPLCLLEARALLVRDWLRPIALVVILGTTAVGLDYQLSINPEAKEPWREAIQYAASELDQADLVVLAPGTDPAAVKYYAPELRQLAMLWSEAVAPSQLGIMPRLLQVPGVTPEQIERRINDSPSRTVLIASDGDEAFARSVQFGRPPDERAVFRCRDGNNEPAGYACGIAVLVWRPLPAVTERDSRSADAAATFGTIQ